MKVIYVWYVLLVGLICFSLVIIKIAGIIDLANIGQMPFTKRVLKEYSEYFQQKPKMQEALPNLLAKYVGFEDKPILPQDKSIALHDKFIPLQSKPAVLLGKPAPAPSQPSLLNRILSRVNTKGNWQTVMKHDLYVFSAYYDENQNDVVAMAIVAADKTVIPVVCGLWYKVQPNIPKLVSAVISKLPDHHNER